MSAIKEAREQLIRELVTTESAQGIERIRDKLRILRDQDDDTT